MTSPAALGAMAQGGRRDPLPPMPVIHTYGICTGWAEPGAVGSLPYKARDLPFAEIVCCAFCGQPGVQPDRGHVAEWLPENATWNEATGEVTWTVKP